jgi:hypothetical protein
MLFKNIRSIFLETVSFLNQIHFIAFNQNCGAIAHEKNFREKFCMND